MPFVFSEVVFIGQWVWVKGKGWMLVSLGLICPSLLQSILELLAVMLVSDLLPLQAEGAWPKSHSSLPGTHPVGSGPGTPAG